MNIDPLRRAHGLLRELYSMKRVDDIEHRWWEVRYIENDVARNAIMKLHEEVRSKDLQIMTTHDIVNFVKSHSDREEAFRFIERLMHLVAVFVQFHRGMTWKTIDTSHAELMFNPMTWNAPPTLHCTVKFRGRQFLVVENNENTSQARYVAAQLGILCVVIVEGYLKLLTLEMNFGRVG